MDILTEIEAFDSGEVVVKANGALALVVAEVMATGGKGSVTIKVEISRAIAEGQLVSVLSGAVSTSLPAHKSTDRVRYIGDDGELTSRNPRQPELPNLQAVDGGGVIRDVGTTPSITREA